MDRRTFIKTGVGAGVLTALGSSQRSVEAEEAPTAPSQAREDFPFLEWTVPAMQKAMEKGSLTASALTAAYLQRIESLDHGGPGVASVLQVNPDAMDWAAELDRERAEKGPRGSLHGIPILLKDNIETRDRTETAAGSLALVGVPVERDSEVARRLKAAGAVLLGKTNLSEWANFRSERSSSGWSARGGQTRNPYALDRSPCGSSSGSGAAVSANFSALAVGTETDGSVICPSTANGVVGLKPSLGLVSRSGIIPLAHSQDTAGPMGRTVTDAAILLSAMVGPDSADPITQIDARNRPGDYTAFLKRDGLKGKRIGVWRDRFGFHEKVDRVMEDGLRALKEAGAELVDPVEMEVMAEVGEAEWTVLLYEFKADIETYLHNRRPGSPYKTLADLAAFNEANREREMPFFEQEIFLKAMKKGPLTEKAYLEALAKCRRLTRDEGLDRVVKEHRLDAVVAPSGGPAWKIDLVNGDHYGGGSSAAAAVSGYGAITVPAGFIFGLPVGLSFIGPAFSEPRLLSMAYAFEQETSVRKPPTFRKSAL